MAFTRKALKEMGLSDEHIEKVFTLHGTSMGDYVPKTDIDTIKQTAAKEALEAAKINPPVKVEESEQYKALHAEYTGFKVKTELKGKGVKDKFLDDLLGKIDREKELDPQLEKLKENYTEYFEVDNSPPPTEPPNKPTFANPPNGNMPTGDNGKKFGDVWGFVPKKE